MGLARIVIAVLALCLGALALIRLEDSRRGIERAPFAAGTTPGTVWRVPGAGPAPVVIILHGFAGSETLMEGFAQVLARAGYLAVTYDLLGHGRNPVPMSGDVDAVAGTTRLLLDELSAVTEAALALPGADGRLALVGHSMASDLIVRRAAEDGRVAALVAVSLFSPAVTAAGPENLLVLTGAGEGPLVAEAERVMVVRGGVPGETLGDPAAGTGRRAVIVPGVEHVGVLFAPRTLSETAAWLDAVFGREGAAGLAAPARGGWIALLTLSVVALAWPLSGLAGRWRAAGPPGAVPRRLFLLAALGPALLTPLILWPLPTRFLPVLVADYLALHFLLQGLLALAVLARAGLVRLGAGDLVLAVGVAAFGILAFGGAIDGYFTRFFPSAPRLPVILAIAAGGAAFMLADAVLTEGGRAPLWRVLLCRGAALLSLGLAVALDPGRLFFLVLILPLILLFFLLFGTLGGWVGRASWRPGGVGLGLGLVLAWSLGVTFPLFAA